MKKGEDDFKKKLLLKIFLGYVGIDQMILKKCKEGLKRAVLFLASMLSIMFSQEILEFIFNTTQKTIFGMRGLLQSITSSVFVTTHFPKLTGLFVITLLVLSYLLLIFIPYILWIKEIVQIVKREDF
jgi:hypothetical protein